MRLIDADALNLLIDANHLLNPKLSVYDVQKIIEGMPTIDRPRGHWIRQDKSRTEFFCSECGRMIDTKPFTRTDNFPFCHCGADMRGDKE